MAEEIDRDKEKLMDRYQLTWHMMDQKISDIHLIRIEEFINWQTVGRFLVTRQELEDIRRNGYDENDRRGRLISLWNRRKADYATYDAMITAMLEAKDMLNATDVCKLLSAGVAQIGKPLGPRRNCLANSPGIAILVTCDYNGSLKGTNIDGDEMMSTFDHCNYIAHPYALRNEKATKDAIIQQVNKVSTELSQYNGESTDKVIIFAFSGHGTNKGGFEQFLTTDNQRLHVMNEIVEPLTKHTGAVADIPKLFFFDACRGNRRMTPNERGGADLGHYFDKGSYENCCISYATIPEHVSYSGGNGSMWMPKLARELKKKNSFQNISAKVMRDVRLEIKRFNLPTQQCEQVYRLNTGPLYLLQE